MLGSFFLMFSSFQSNKLEFFPGINLNIWCALVIVIFIDVLFVSYRVFTYFKDIFVHSIKSQIIPPFPTPTATICNYLN